MTPEGNSRSAREQLSHKPSLRPLSASTAVDTQTNAADDIESISSLSSSSLDQRVSLEAQESSLITKVQGIQQEAMTLREEIASGRGDVSHIQSSLDKMLDEHHQLATTVAMVANSLEVVNERTKGRAAKYIASSHTSLGTELCLLGQHLKDLEETLHDDTNTTHLLSPPSPSPHSPSSTSPPHISVDYKSSPPPQSPPLIKPDDRGSPHLPEIYLTPSRPHHYDISPLTLQSSITSCNSRSLASSLTPQLDPFTPDTTPAQPSILQEEEEETTVATQGEAAENGEQTSLNAVQGRENNSPRHSILRHNAGARSVRGYKADTTSSVLKWLRHQTSGYHPPPLHSDERGRTREEVDGLSDGSPDGFLQDVLSDDDGNGGGLPTGLPEGVAAASNGVGELGGPLSPPVSSPCADSGISSDNFSHRHSSLPPITHTHDLTHDTHQPSPLPTITMSDIDALRVELARLRQEIMSPSGWSQALARDSRASDTVFTEQTQPLAGSGVSSSPPDVLDTPRPSYTFSNLERSYQFTPVSRPYHSVSRPFHYTTSAGFPRHRRLFSNSGDSMYRDSRNSIPRDQQSSIRTAPSQPQVVNQSTQTTPPSTPTTGACFSTKRTRQQDFTSCPYTPTSSIITTLPSSHPLPPSLTPTFTPRLIVHTFHSSPPATDGGYRRRTAAATLPKTLSYHYH